MNGALWRARCSIPPSLPSLHLAPILHQHNLSTPSGNYSESPLYAKIDYTLEFFPSLDKSDMLSMWVMPRTPREGGEGTVGRGGCCEGQEIGV